VLNKREKVAGLKLFSLVQSDERQSMRSEKKRMQALTVKVNAATCIKQGGNAGKSRPFISQKE